MTSSGPLRVTLVSNYFHPDFSATGQLLTELAVELRRMGCEVVVYSAHPTYGIRGGTRDFELYEGVEIHRVPTTHLDKNRRLGRILNAATYFLSAGWVLLWQRNRGPLLIVSNPPFLGFLGYLLKVLRGQHYVYLLHDVFPDLAVTLGYIRADSWVRKVWDRVNDRVINGASRIIVLGEAMKALVVRKGGGTPAIAERTSVIHNWVDEEFIRPIPKAQNAFAREQGLVDPFVVMYSGNIGLSHNLETVIEAADRMKDRNIVFLFIGDGGKKPKLESMATQRGLRNVRFLHYQPRERLPLSATCSDLSMVALERGIEGLSMPSKLYTIMASGRPVVALVETGFEVARMVETADCGKSVDPSDVDGLVRVVDFYETNREACARAGSNGRKYFQDHFTRTRSCRAYLDVLESARAPG